MRILIIEDESAAAEKLIRLLSSINPEYELIGPLTSIEESFDWLRSHELPDLIFIDIELNDGNSFELLNRMNITTPLIFTTSYDSYALESFAFSTVDYLLKPFTKDQLKKSIEKLMHLRGSKNIETSLPYFVVRHGKQIMPIPTDQIAYFYADHGLSYVVTESGHRYLTRHTISQLSEQVEATSFFQVNRSCLVRRSAIAKAKRMITGKLMLQLLPESRKTMYVSREKAKAFAQWLGR